MLAISIGNINKDNQHDYAHRLLRECLKPFSIDYTPDSRLSFGECGKPELADHPGIFFNISHGMGIAASIAADVECGIDCEKVREFRPNVLKRAFTEAERQMIEEAPAEKRDLLFFQLWTLKESYIKATGKGLSQSMRSAGFSIENGKISTNIEDFQFKQYILKNGRYVVSICKKKSSFK